MQSSQHKLIGGVVLIGLLAVFGLSSCGRRLALKPPTQPSPVETPSPEPTRSVEREQARQAAQADQAEALRAEQAREAPATADHTQYGKPSVVTPTPAPEPAPVPEAAPTPAPAPETSASVAEPDQELRMASSNDRTSPTPESIAWADKIIRSLDSGNGYCQVE